jgi:hypothetical protein
LKPRVGFKQKLRMKTWGCAILAGVLTQGLCSSLQADQAAIVTESVNIVDRSAQQSDDYSPAPKGTSIHDGEAVKTGAQSRAELKLPSASVTRMGSNTIFNYSVASNTIDLQAGTILFCKPKEGAPRLNIKTAAVTAGIVGTTGFASVRGQGSKRTYIVGIIEGHAIARADDHPFLLGPGDILEFRPGTRPFIFAYDVPRFVKSFSLLKNFHNALPNQSYIDEELVSYADDVSRGFIVPPSDAIDYTSEIPVLSTVAYSSAQNAQGQSHDNGTPAPSAPPVEPTGSSRAPTSTPPPTAPSSSGYPGRSSYH